MYLSKNEEEIDAVAKKWASVISNKYVREDAEEAARIALRHGIKELPELREADLGGRKRIFGLTRANFHAAICEGAPNIINVNKRAYKTWVKDTEDAVRGGWHSQSNTILHELGHYIDFCNDPDYFRSVEHEWKMDKADKELIKKQLSEYSLTNRAEFEAELNAAIMRGKVLPRELLSYSHMNQVDTPLAKRMLSLASGDSVCLPSEDVSKGFKDAIKALYHQKGSSFSIDIMADKNVQSLIEAHTSVLDRNLQRLEMSDLMRQRLTRSNYIFSGIKTFHELNEAFPSMLDENGNKKPFERFLNDVQKINDTYNANYLHAEYNFVQASATMAAKWEQFSEDGDRYYLQYRTAKDDKVRPEHAALDGVTLPMSDSFWETYYPPNGWNCRCTVVQVRKQKYPATEHSEAMSRGEEAMNGERYNIFRFNSGKQGKTMPDYNPYTIKRCNDCDVAKGKLTLSLPDNEICAACKFVQNCALDRDKSEACVSKKELLQSSENFTKKSESLQTGNYFQTRKTLRLGLDHARTSEEVAAQKWIAQHLENLRFVRFSPLGEVKDMTSEIDIRNIKKKKDRGATGYNEYEIEINGETWQLKTEIRKNKKETLYNAFKKK